MRLDEGEVALLETLLQELIAVVVAEDGDDPVRARLYPAAYDDPSDAAAYRDMAEAGLQAERVQRIRACADDLVAHPPDLPLPEGAGDRWLRVINDLRLALGTRLGVTEDWDHQVDADDPEQLPQATYLWLTAVQDTLVRALM